MSYISPFRPNQQRELKRLQGELEKKQKVAERTIQNLQVELTASQGFTGIVQESQYALQSTVSSQYASTSSQITTLQQVQGGINTTLTQHSQSIQTHGPKITGLEQAQITNTSLLEAHTQSLQTQSQDIIALNSIATNLDTITAGLTVQQDTLATTVTSQGDILENTGTLATNTAAIVNTLQEDLQTLTASHEALTTSVSGLDGRLGTAESDLMDITTDLGTATTTLTNHTTAISSLETTVSDHDISLANVESLANSTASTVGILQTDLQSLEGNHASLEIAVDAIDGRLLTAEGSLSTMGLELNTATSTLLDHDNDISAVQTDILAIQGNITDLDLYTADLTSDITSIQALTAAIESTLTSHTSILAAQGSSITGLETSVGDLTTRVTTSEADILALQASGGSGGGTFTSPSPTQLLFTYHEGYNRIVNGPTDAPLPGGTTYSGTNTLPCTVLFPSSVWVNSGHLNASKKLIGAGLYCAVATLELTGLTAPATLTTFLHRFRLIRTGYTLEGSYIGDSYRTPTTTLAGTSVTVGPFYFQITENEAAELVLDSLFDFTTGNPYETYTISRVCVSQISIAGFYPSSIPAGQGIPQPLPIMPTFTARGAMTFPDSFTGMTAYMAGLFVEDTTITFNSQMSGSAWRDVPSGYEVRVSSYSQNSVSPTAIYGVHEMFENSSLTFWNPSGPYGAPIRTYNEDGNAQPGYLQEPYTATTYVGGSPEQKKVTTYPGGTAEGEYVQWKFPFFVQFTALQLKARDAALTRAPKNCSILGSHDGNSWEFIQSLNYTGFGTNTWQSRGTAAGIYYKYLRFVIHNTQGATVMNLAECKLQFNAFS